MTLIGSERLRLFSYIGYSHWGLFRIPLATGPAWFIDAVEPDDDLVEEISDGESEKP